MADEILDSWSRELELASRTLEAQAAYVESLKAVIAARKQLLFRDTGASVELNGKAEEAQVETPKEEPIGRSEFVLKLIADRAPREVWPKEIKKVAFGQWKDLPKNFPYTTLWKLKEAGKIIEGPDGGYIAKESQQQQEAEF